MTEPITLDDIKRHLVLDASDTSEDDFLSSMITAARRAVELRTRRSVVGENRMLVLAEFPSSDPILLGWLVPSSPAAPIVGRADVELTGGTVATVAVNYYAADGTDTTLDPSLYYAALDEVPALLRPADAWPLTESRPDAVRIAYTISPMAADDLEMAKHAIRLTVGNWYANREPTQVDARGVPAQIPLTLDWLLDPLTQFADD